MKRRGILACFLLLAFSTLGKSYSNWRFDLLTQYDGLSSNQVNSVVQDNDGYIWIGTGNGLNRYDGTSFDKFTAGNDNRHLKDVMIYSLFVDGPYVWVGAFNTIQRLDTRTLTFKHFNTLLGKAPISDILRGPDGRIWIGSLEPGCWEYDEEADSIIEIPFPNDIKPSIFNFNVDSDSTLWISTQFDGVFFCKKGKRFIQQLKFEDEQYNNKLTRITSVLKFDSLLFISCHGNGLFEYNLTNRQLKGVDLVNEASSNTYYNKMIADNYGNIWIAGDNSGLIRYNPQNKVVEVIGNSPNDKSSLSSNTVTNIFFDREQNLWVGTRNGGLNKSIRYSGKGFQYFNINDHGEFRGPVSEISSLFIRTDNTAWLGTDGQGLYYFSKKDKILLQVKLPDKFNTASIQSIYEDEQSNLYFGTYQYGFYSAKIKFVNAHPFVYYVEKCKYIDADVRKIFPDSLGNLWLGTDGDGLILYHPQQGILEQYQTNLAQANSTILTNYINDFWIDQSKNIWIGCGSGISFINRSKNKVVNLTAENQTQINDFYVTAFETDKKGCLWIATKNGVYSSVKKGTEIDSLLSETNIPNLSFNHITTTNGLSDDYITDIIIDTDNNVWLATENGISYINQQNGKISTYDINDGLGGNIFNMRGAALTSDDEIFLTGKHGLSIINPKKLKYNTVAPNTQLTNLQILAHKIIPGEVFNRRVVLKNTIGNTSAISIKPIEKVFSVEFVSLSFVDPRSNLFRYKLDGFDKEWTYTSSSNNTCTYTNLSPGEYTLFVEGSNNDKVWSNHAAVLKIKVVPPFYLTIPFIIFNVLFFIVAIVLLQYRRERNQKMIKKELKETVESRTHDLVIKNKEIADKNEALEKANQLKNLFFSIIAHDLLNPVSALNQLMELIYNNYQSMSKEESENILKNAFQSSQNTLDLIQDLLMWSRNQTNTLRFEYEQINMFQLVNEVIQTIEQQSAQKGIAIVNQLTNGITCFIDEPTIKLVFRNLLSNALKFSNRSSEIIIGTIETQNNSVQFFVRDFGVGIAKEKIDRLFRIYPNNSSVGTSGEQGTGLGLNLCHEFVIKNKGEIWVESKVGEGSYFYFTLPKSELFLATTQE